MSDMTWFQILRNASEIPISFIRLSARYHSPDRAGKGWEKDGSIAGCAIARLLRIIGQIHGDAWRSGGPQTRALGHDSARSRKNTIWETAVITTVIYSSGYKAGEVSVICVLKPFRSALSQRMIHRQSVRWYGSIACDTCDTLAWFTRGSVSHAAICGSHDIFISDVFLAIGASSDGPSSVG